MISMSSNNQILDKIIEGTQHEEQVTINYNDEPYTFTLRPLTAKQLSKIQNLERKGMSIQITGNGQAKPFKINAGSLAENQMEAMINGISLSLDASLDKVKLLPSDLVESLFQEVIKVSNVTEQDLVLIRNFQ